MTNEKTRVKDLSVELGVSNKELLQVLRDLEIEAKSHMSLIEVDEVEEVRAKFKNQGQATEVIRKEIQPGMIVRRRRKAKPARKKDEPVLSTAEDTPEPDAVQHEEEPVAQEVQPPEPVETPATDEPESGAESASDSAASHQEEDAESVPAKPIVKVIKPEDIEPVQTEAAEPEAEPVAEPETVVHEAAEPQADTSDTEVKVEAEKEAQPVGAEVESKDEKASEEPPAVSETDSGKASAKESSEVAPKGASEGAGASGSESTQEEGKKKKKRKKKKEAPSEPQVRIISRPEVVPEAAKKPSASTTPSSPGRSSGRPSGGRPGGPGGPRPGGGRPGGGRPNGPGGPRPGGPGGPGMGAPGGPGGPGGKKKRKKDKRVVEFPQGGSEDDRRRASAQLKKKKGQPIKDKTGGKARGGKRKKDRFDAEYFEQQQDTTPTTQPIKAAKRKLKVDEAIRLADIAHQMGVKAQAVIKVLFGLGVMATINQSLDIETATLVASEFGYEVEKVGFSEEEYLIPKEEDAPESLKPRPPVVTIMGHVDHGKTSLLDAIRETNVTGGEAGGITQHIGAYHVETARGEVVFLDTPGHEAFTTMRARGAQVTDIVILVVAADDGVMDQTREAINHSRAANVPILVAVNKIDKEGAEPDRVKRELAELGLLPEDWGGDTIFAEVSAKQRVGLDELLEMVLLQAEVLELKANPDKLCRGHIVEARLDKGRGAVATLLIQEGTLNQGDPFVCGLFSGRVRALFNDKGKKIKKAGPAWPVEVQGLEGVPEAGDEFASMADEKVARRIAEARQMRERERVLAKESKVTLEDFLSRRADMAEVMNLNLIIKSDVQGSLEAVVEALMKLSTEEVKVNVIHGGTGAITESDILLASASDAIVMGFNVRPNIKVKEVAEKEKVDIRFYDIIYKLVGEVKDAMSGMLSPLIREVSLGSAEVRETFSVPKVGIIAGCAVQDGKIVRNAKIRLLRESVVIHTGQLSSLKRFKDDVREVQKGYECGMGIEKYNDIKVGDVIEAFEEVEEARTLDD